MSPGSDLVSVGDINPWILDCSTEGFSILLNFSRMSCFLHIKRGHCHIIFILIMNVTVLCGHAKLSLVNNITMRDIRFNYLCKHTTSKSNSTGPLLLMEMTSGLPSGLNSMSTFT